METSIYEEFNKSLYKNSGQSGTTSASTSTNVANDPSVALSDNIIEFGQFKRMSISGVLLTIGPGDDVQKSVDKALLLGGGVVRLLPGTYKLFADLSIPGGVTLEGVSRDSVIIDCNTSYSVKIIGTNAYTTGTIAMTSGDTTVTGTGTTFTSGMVGQYIMIGGLYYKIVTFTDTTHLEISDYSAPSVSGVSTIIATVNFYSTIAKLTIINSATAGLRIQYAQEPYLDNIIITDCGDAGIDIDDSAFMLLLVSIYSCEINLDMNNVWGWEINYSDIALSTTGQGVKIVGCGSATVFDSAFTENAAQGFTLQDCSNIAFVSNAVANNASHGIEFVSGNSDCQLYGTNPFNNGGDGIKLTATTDNISISTLSTKDNGGWGINIAAATCDNNVLVGVIASGNVSGSISDSGTGTLKSTTVNILP